MKAAAMLRRGAWGSGLLWWRMAVRGSLPPAPGWCRI